MADTSVSISSYLSGMYAELDKVAAGRIAELGGSTCKKGCAHCCMLFTAVPIADGILLAEELLPRPDWKDYVERLAQVGGMMDYEGIGKVSWFERKIQCPLLNQSDNTCSVYEKRPAACRYHAVQSPVELCSPDAPRDTVTKIIYLMPLEESSWDVSKAFHRSYPEILGSDMLIAAPIPIMVLFAMVLLCGDEPERAKYIAERAKHHKVLPPYPWLMKYGKNLVAEQDLESNSVAKQLESQGIPTPDIMVRK